MQKSEGESRVCFRRQNLIIFLILSIPPLVVGHLLLVYEARQSYREVIGTLFSHRDDDAQTHLINDLERVSAQVSNLTAVPEIQTVVRQSNEQELTQQELDKNIHEVEG